MISRINQKTFGVYPYFIGCFGNKHIDESRVHDLGLVHFSNISRNIFHATSGHGADLWTQVYILEFIYYI